MNNPFKQAFKDMSTEIYQKRQELKREFVIGWNQLYTDESRRLNAELGITYLNHSDYNPWNKIV